MWPDGEFRRNDPKLCRREIREMQQILDVLATLNRTGLYTAFFEFFGHTGTLNIQIYAGRWNYRKDPVVSLSVDCRKYPLRDYATTKPLLSEDFLERMILMVQ